MKLVSIISCFAPTRRTAISIELGTMLAVLLYVAIHYNEAPAGEIIAFSAFLLIPLGIVLFYDIAAQIKEFKLKRHSLNNDTIHTQ